MPRKVSIAILATLAAAGQKSDISLAAIGPLRHALDLVSTFLLLV